MTLISPEDWRPQGVAELENRAWEALREVDQSVCVTAGAGAGKTEFLAQKATYLLQTGLCPASKRILAISFKVDAAKTLADRVARRCSDIQAHRFHSMTFDAFTKMLVDQFRCAIPERYRPPADYQITFDTDAILDDFLRSIDLPQLEAKKLREAVARTALPIERPELSKAVRRILSAYWQDQYKRDDRTYLTFAMINRLADYIVRVNPTIARVLRATYPVVFLDEFQDTTHPQFEFLMNAFGSDGPKFTAVGDDKQRIMGWAGAMPDAFAEFTQRCSARRISLLSNWRSHGDLVAIQHIIAQRIDPNVEPVIARRERAVDGSVSAIWVFDDRDDEVALVAKWIAAEIARRKVAADRLAILVRSYADRAADEIAPALADYEIVLRNVARHVGDIAIQDLLVEKLTSILLPFLRLGSTSRDSAAWSQAQDNMQSLDGVTNADDVTLQRTNRRLQGIARAAREYMNKNAPAPDLAVRLVQLLVEEIGEEAIRSSTPVYQRHDDFVRVRNGFEVLLKECLTGAESWQQALDRFVGKDQVPLMTIHKSKGMEFHTMIFFGLDSKSWASLKPDAAEELNSFFVAFTRAEQRAFFTCCKARGRPIGWLEDLLGHAVPRVPGKEILNHQL